jgi:hypothetical protein
MFWQILLAEPDPLSLIRGSVAAIRRSDRI